jgi:CRP/FNR family transcriptional regulator, cyclic AMP receptor protein
MRERQIEGDMNEPNEPTTTVDRRTLDNIVMLEGLTATERAELEAACIWRRYRHGERLFERGSSSNEVFFIVEGSVSVVSSSATGRDVSFARAGAGEVIGEMAAIDGLPRSASVTAAEDSLVAVLPATRFVALLKHNGDIAVELLRRLSTMVRRTGARVVELSSLDARNRVYAELLRLAKPDLVSPDLWTVRPLPPLRELAASACTTRELVNSALNTLYPKGLVRRRGNTLYLLDKSALESVVRAAEDRKA